MEMKKKEQKIIKNKPGCVFIRINPDEKDFDIFVEIGKIYYHISESNEKLTKESTENY